MRRILIVGWLLVIAPLVGAQFDPSGGHRDRPLTDLPRSAQAHVNAGHVTMFADFSNLDPASGRVPVYVINRTPATVTLSTQDGDAYLLPEVSRGGRWVRARAFQLSDCGNSYYGTSLRPRHFLLLDGHVATEGEVGTARFRLYRQSIEIVSNEGPARFSVEAIRAAAVDELAMESGDAATLNEALSRRPPIDHAARRAALRRLGELPAAEATPILIRLLEEPARNQEDVDDAFRALRTVNPMALARHIEHVLASGSLPLRRQELENLRFVGEIRDQALFDRLTALARSPREPNLDMILPFLASTRRPEIEPLLASIEGDTRYAEVVRIRAAYERAQWFGPDLVDVRIDAPGNYSDGHHIPVNLTLRLTNTTGSRMNFAYRDLSEVFTFYLTESSGRDHVFHVPRARTPATGTSTRVQLAPGETREFTFALLDYFELHPGRPATVWVNVHIPGLHTIPESSGGGIGLNIQL